jgi:hypothetical protein
MSTIIPACRQGAGNGTLRPAQLMGDGFKMSRWRGLLVLIVLGWLGAWSAVAQAQPEAMPPTILSGGQPMGLVSQPPIVQPRSNSPAPTIVPDGQALSVEGPLLNAPASGGAVSWPGTSLAPWTWQVLPEGLMYKSYLAGPKESRLASAWVHEQHLGWLWDVTLGARAGLLRYGTQDALWPEGWELDVEGAAFPRLDADRNLVSADYRVGVPLTARMGPWEGKFGYYHISSHLADEFMLGTGDFARLNYVRDGLLLGLAFRPTPNWRLYGETGWAFHTDGGAQPWEFQFGAEYSLAQPTGVRGSPFVAVNGLLRQDVDFGGSFTGQAGWQWRGTSGRLARIGAQYFNGMSEQRQFFNKFEEQIGVGLWYDF